LAKNKKATIKATFLLFSQNANIGTFILPFGSEYDRPFAKTPTLAHLFYLLVRNTTGTLFLPFVSEYDSRVCTPIIL